MVDGTIHHSFPAGQLRAELVNEMPLFSSLTQAAQPSATGRGTASTAGYVQHSATSRRPEYAMKIMAGKQAV